MKPFSNEFMMGAATAAHQVEGNNVNSDFWAMENVPNSMYKEPSLDAVDHYNRFKEDIQLLVDAGLNTYRFSIEWARIEPTKGSFDHNEIDHYRAVLEYCHEKSVTPIVTLHHFSSPKWVITEGGWESESTIGYFEKYSRYVVTELGDLIPYICTINEANMGKQIAKIMKRMSGSHTNSSEKKESNGDIQVGLNVEVKEKMEKYYRALGAEFGMDPRNIQTFHNPRTENGERIIMNCHEAARKAIKEVNPTIKVGITFSLYDHQALPGGEKFVLQEQHEDFLDYLPYIQDDDFLGVQNYSRKIHGANGYIKPDENTRLTKMGYEYYPEALGNVIRFVSKHWNKPIIVTENGLSTDNDEERVEFIERALAGVQDCMDEGIQILGYTYWSLLDNFEWQLGYDQTFGLIAVDRTTQTRYPKESLSFLGEIKKTGIIK
ncbi:glycoside hydrolase family 1 protein [Alkalihalobacillus hemicellulosilyticus]|uniref:Beta-galactosidase n=1 Tax=Halalkalibacter hemicellulosilyticusJCM 9152 TaxID=1236971 RepID=W4QI21_9BACI|nr:family 1 glycosylhydrolase [Halalkalibacter hemicellulosilyticus]GAE31542.1 beta-galactosidase [Halalkalibacter hemicellulosilyticusJCM 9152]